MADQRNVKVRKKGQKSIKLSCVDLWFLQLQKQNGGDFKFNYSLELINWVK